MKGKLPKTATVNHARVENKKVWRKFNLYSCSKLAKIKIIPTNIVTKDEEAKLWLF